MNGLLLRDRALSWCAAASVVVVGVGLVSAPVHVDRPVFRAELRAGVVLESAETGLGALVSAVASPPVADGTSAASAATPSANDTAPGCSTEFLWNCGLATYFAYAFAFLVILPIQYYVISPIQSTLQNLANAVQAWWDSVKAFVATIFPPSASARAVSPPAAARRSSAPGVAAGATVSAAVANHAEAQALSAAAALSARSLERTAAPHRRGGVPAAVAHRAASPHSAAAARPARAATRSVAHAAAATPRNQQFRSG